MAFNTDSNSIFSDIFLEKLVKDSLVSVLMKMLKVESVFLEKINKEKKKNLTNFSEIVVSLISFSGQIKGYVYLYFSKDLPQLLCSKMLNIPKEKLASTYGLDMVNDCIQELTNIIVGSLKNRLCKHGYNCSLSLPQILNRQVLETAPCSKETKILKKIYQFKIENEVFLYELILNLNPMKTTNAYKMYEE